jgi:hypothetical protein
MRFWIEIVASNLTRGNVKKQNYFQGERQVTKRHRSGDLRQPLDCHGTIVSFNSQTAFCVLRNDGEIGHVTL